MPRNRRRAFLHYHRPWSGRKAAESGETVRREGASHACKGEPCLRNRQSRRTAKKCKSRRFIERRRNARAAGLSSGEEMPSAIVANLDTLNMAEQGVRIA